MGIYEEILLAAREYEGEMRENYRQLHKTAESGMQLTKTTSFCREKLEKMGYFVKDVAGGLVCDAGKGARGVLLRADMDALPVAEESGVDFVSENGRMHACGHDMHTAMLLCAARLIKEREEKLPFAVRLCFQPGEETLSGAKAMIDGGLLSDFQADGAMMLHVLSGTDYETGTVIIPPKGIGASGADFFRVTVKGKGCHGSTPHLGRDPLLPLCHMIAALSATVSREVPAGGGEVLTVGSVRAGEAANAIPEEGSFSGTLRSYSDEGRERLRERLVSVSQGIGDAFGCSARVEFTSGCPSFVNCHEVVEYCKELFLESVVIPEGTRGGGSEDFAYVSRLAPSVMLCLAAGKREEGYTYPLHSPKVRFDERALVFGAAAYAAFALGMLRNTEGSVWNAPQDDR